MQLMQPQQRLQFLIRRACSFGASLPRDWVPNRDLASILHGADVLLSRTSSDQPGLPGVWHNLKLLTVQSLSRVNAPTALSALHHLSRHGACSLVEARKLQDCIAKGMLSLSYNQLLMVFAAVAQAGAPLTPLLRETALRKMRSLVAAVDDSELWMVGEVILRHFPDHIGFVEALLLRCQNTILRGAAAKYSALAASSSSSSGGGHNSGPAVLSNSDVLLLTFVITKCRGASMTSVPLAEAALERVNHNESPMPRQLLLALAIAAPHASHSPVCKAATTRFVEDILKDMKAGVVECRIALRAIAHLCLIAPREVPQIASLAAETATALLHVPPGTLPDQKNVLQAARLVAAFWRCEAALAATDADQANAATALDDARVLLRTKLQRVIASSDFTILADLITATAQAQLLDATTGGFVISRLKDGSGAPANVAQRCLALLQQHNVTTTNSSSSGSSSMGGDQRVGGAQQPFNGDSTDKQELSARLVVALAETNNRLADTVLNSLAALRGADALSAGEALQCVAICTNAQRKVPAARAQLTEIAYLVNAASRQTGGTAAGVITGCLMGLFAAGRICGLASPAAHGGLAARHMARLLAPAVRDAAQREMIVAPTSPLLDALTRADALQVLYSMAPTRYWPAPTFLAALRPTAEGAEPCPPWQVAEGIRLGCRYGIDEPAVVSGWVAELMGCVDHIPTSGIEELLHHARLSWSAADFETLAKAMKDVVIRRAEGRPLADLGAAEKVALLACATHCAVHEDAAYHPLCMSLLESLGHFDPQWPLRPGLTAFGALQSLPGGVQPLKTKSAPLWKESVKRLSRLSVVDSPFETVQMIADCVVIALRHGASSSALDSLATKLETRGVVPHTLASLAKHAAALPSRRPAVSELIGRGFDYHAAKAMSAASLASMIRFFSTNAERAASGIIKSDAAIATAWAALELKLDRVAKADVATLVASCPPQCSPALAARVKEHGWGAVEGPHFAECVTFLHRWRPVEEWKADALTRLAQLRDKLPVGHVQDVEKVLLAS